MMHKSNLNPDAKSFEYQIPTVAHDFNDFFTVLFTNWGKSGVDSMVSRIETVKTIGVAKILFEELFKIIYTLTKESGTQLKVDNIILAINTLDNILPEIIIEHTKQSASQVTKEYFEVRKIAFEHCFKRIVHSFDLVVESNSSSFLNELSGVLLVLSKISCITYNRDYIDLFIQNLWQIYVNHRSSNDIILCIIQTISFAIDPLLSLLLFKVDPSKSKEELEADLKRSKMVASIFTELKNDVIYRQFTREMLVFVLHIIDKHDRFIGQFVDAIPENVLKTAGYIACPTESTCFETEDVYQDYETFLDAS